MKKPVSLPKNYLSWALALYGLTPVNLPNGESSEPGETRERLSAAIPPCSCEEIPLVTVIVPAGRSADTVWQTLDWVSAQSWPRLEVLFTAEDDDTAAAVENYRLQKVLPEKIAGAGRLLPLCAQGIPKQLQILPLAKGS